MNCLHVGERCEHHLDFGRTKNARIMAHVAIVDLHIGLSEEAKDVREQVAFRSRQIAMPVLDVIGQRHLLRQPVYLLLGQPRIISPRITERLVHGLGVK